jgi:hypothetical protein
MELVGNGIHKNIMNKNIIRDQNHIEPSYPST